MVRDSKHGGADSPYTLTVHNNNKVFNINIRIRPDGMIALGKEKVEENVSIPALLKSCIYPGHISDLPQHSEDG